MWFVACFFPRRQWVSGTKVTNLPAGNSHSLGASLMLDSSTYLLHFFANLHKIFRKNEETFLHVAFFLSPVPSTFYKSLRQRLVCTFPKPS